MKSKFYLFILIISILCLASDCGRDNIPTYYISYEMKKYIDFPVGSFWVYQDSVSNKIDSILLEKTNNEIISMNNYNYKYESIKQIHFSTYKDSLISSTIYTDCFENTNICFIYSGIGIYIGYVPLGNIFSNIKYVCLYDSIQINNVWYEKVKRFDDINNGNQFYWAPNIGLVKKNIIAQDKNWLLTYCYINN